MENCDTHAQFYRQFYRTVCRCMDRSFVRTQSTADGIPQRGTAHANRKDVINE